MTVPKPLLGRVPERDIGKILPERLGSVVRLQSFDNDLEWIGPDLREVSFAGAA